jgi:hypothetical protein
MVNKMNRQERRAMAKINKTAFVSTKNQQNDLMKRYKFFLKTSERVTSFEEFEEAFKMFLPVGKSINEKILMTLEGLAKMVKRGDEEIVIPGATFGFFKEETEKLLNHLSVLGLKVKEHDCFGSLILEK